jgi:glycosyltransferase involved in cell wall biosynthesis
MAERLSVLVITRDEEDEIRDCLASLSWADEVVVVDSGSKDRTVKIAREMGARVLEHPFETHARQRNWALPHLAHRWVLVVDADERVPDELAREVRAALESPSGPGYWLRRSNWFLGRRMEHGGWGGDRVLRLFDRERGRYDDRAVHEAVVIEGAGTLPTLRAPLDHHTFRSFEDYLPRMVLYGALGARDAAARGERASVRRLLLNPLARFVKSYLLRGGFREGRRGLVLAWMTAFSAWMKYARLYEREVAGEGSGPGREEAG